MDWYRKLPRRKKGLIVFLLLLSFPLWFPLFLVVLLAGLAIGMIDHTLREL